MRAVYAMRLAPCGRSRALSRASLPGRVATRPRARRCGGRMNKLKVGFFAFTEITGGQHRAYNEWHMLDHMPEQFPIPGIAFGQRWVSTPACRAARLYEDPALAPTHYLT